eukprot:TRINITY_DN82630_c0_g1_i1.p1 TRINITY_DN82630_c0_g1~~TRINITY_DN82630_c0_g1_i1.p1  ORF type:complete len:480 (-),score=121.59 TRINITY_DN82630_c0_g1_i1:196-1635(-)
MSSSSRSLARAASSPLQHHNTVAAQPMQQRRRTAVGGSGSATGLSYGAATTAAAASSSSSSSTKPSSPSLNNRQFSATAAQAAPKEPAPPPAEAAPEPQCTYNAERVIGNGTFGIVYSAHIMETDETVAIKKVFVDRRYRNHELQVWRELRHPNIVMLKHAFYTSGDSVEELYLNIVMEYMPETAYCVMRRFAKQGQNMAWVLIQLLTYQVFRALAYLHITGVVHRDIKPQNLLVDAGRSYVLKLCDFGSAALVGPGRPPLVAYICSRYYRAPELVFGTTTYGTAVDLWSVGCVLAEMIRGRPLFTGEDGVGQLMEIVKVLGAPTREEGMAMNPQFVKFTFPPLPCFGWDTVFLKGTRSDALELMSELLRYDPEARMRPLEACAHRFFDALREEKTRCPDGQLLPIDLFILTNRERRNCPEHLREKLVPHWHAAVLARTSATTPQQASREESVGAAGSEAPAKSQRSAGRLSPSPREAG